MTSGVVQLVYSVLATVGVDRIRKQMDREDVSLIAVHDYCTQILHTPTYSHILLHTTTYYCILHTTYYIPHTTYYILHTAYYLLLTTYCILLTTYHILLDSR